MARVISAFPISLLAENQAERVAYFRKYVIAHPRLKQVDTALWNAIREPAGTAMIFVCGPTGVGKTTMRRHLEARLRDEFHSGRAEGRLAIAGVDAVAPDDGKFAWGDFYRRTLKILEQPFLPEHTAQAPIGIFRDRFGEIVHGSHVQKHELRLALEQSLQHRRPSALLIDEAQHLAKTASGRGLQDQMDCLKFLSQQSQTLMVLIGTYELQALRNLSGQLARRSLHLHFPRYGVSAGDLKAFRNIIYNLQLHLPLNKAPNLLRHWEYLYTRSLGCTGILKDWLTRTLAATLAEDNQTISLKSLQDYALSIPQCEQIAREFIEGERYFAEEPEADKRLAGLIGLEQAAIDESAAVAETDRARRSVGGRKPKRDKVGLSKLEELDQGPGTTGP